MTTPNVEPDLVKPDFGLTFERDLALRMMTILQALEDDPVPPTHAFSMRWHGRLYVVRVTRGA